MSGCTAEQEVRHADWELGRKGGLSEESFGSDSVTFMVWRMMSAKGIKMTASYLSMAWERGETARGARLDNPTNHLLRLSCMLYFTARGFYRCCLF